MKEYINAQLPQLTVSTVLDADAVRKTDGFSESILFHKLL